MRMLEPEVFRVTEGEGDQKGLQRRSTYVVGLRRSGTANISRRPEPLGIMGCRRARSVSTVPSPATRKHRLDDS